MMLGGRFPAWTGSMAKRRDSRPVWIAVMRMVDGRNVSDMGLIWSNEWLHHRVIVWSNNLY